MPQDFDVREELRKLPNKPGVYIMHDKDDTILYVGKAINLHNRVRSYFKENIGRGPQIDKMVSLIARFEYIVTDSELEALVLESNLIKEHRPKYNTMLKDDKSYPFIKVTVQEAYPRVLFARQMKKDKNRYFGPYTSGGAVKDVIELLRKLYQVRSCSRNLPRDCGKDRPCLYYHMKQCTGPCTGHVDQKQYRENIQKVIRFLNGDFQDTIDELTDKMMTASEEMRFEDAMELGQQKSGLHFYWEDQGDREIVDVPYALSAISDSASLWVQDRYNYDTSDKLDAIVDDLENCQAADDTFSINFTSTSGSGKVGHPKKYATTINDYLLSYDWQAGTSYGIVVVDFATKDLAKCIYETNTFVK